MILRDLLTQSAQQNPDAVAVSGPDGILSYGEIDRLSNRIARGLHRMGVRRGERVGLWLEKSCRAVAAMQAVLRLGAAYVPLDPLSPAGRVHTILADCGVRALVSTVQGARALWPNGRPSVACLCADGGFNGGLSWKDLEGFADGPVNAPESGDDHLAYILYTSGSTGTPKGVCISNRNAMAFIEWAGDELRAAATDRFSNHAPFHFDLSVLDLYVAFRAGARVCLIPDGLSYVPRRLVDFIQQQQITIWYSVPSALVLMMEQGRLLEQASLPLRAVLFAGEPFPVKHLGRLVRRWPTIRYLNLYGPTETNVCTYFEVQKIEEGQTRPVPIGRACSGDKVWAVKEDGSPAQIGEEGELVVTGPTVMLGYWGKPANGNSPYRTGDLVRHDEDGNYSYVGRRDHMVKVRGHRIELGDIEAALTAHPCIHETALTLAGSGVEARLIAHVVSRRDPAPGLIEIKRHCAERLPRYMIVDEVRYLAALPRTRNGKVDRLALAAAGEPRARKEVRK